MSHEFIDTLVIGAGQAGLAAGYHRAQKNADFMLVDAHGRIGRTVSAEEGRPRIDDGRVLDVSNVIWCTGFRPDFGWIPLPVFAEDGYPHHRRSGVAATPGLYFIGLRFLHRFRSSLIGGVGEDAEYVVDHLTSRD